jgi:hypothetical protein
MNLLIYEEFFFAFFNSLSYKCTDVAVPLFFRSTILLPLGYEIDGKVCMSICTIKFGQLFLNLKPLFMDEYYERRKLLF